MNGVRVLVLDAETRQSLAACRALGRAGYEVGTAAHYETALASWSRYASRYHRLPGRSDPIEFAEALRGLVADHGYDVVVAAMDPSISRLAAAEPGIPTVPVLGPPLERLVDKVELARVAAAAGVAYPPTEAVVDGRLAGLPERLDWPVVVKPARSADVSNGQIAHRSGAAVARDDDELGAAARRVLDDGLVPIVQRRIERSLKVNVTVFRRGGRSEVRFPYLVLRDVPLTGGIAVALETLAVEWGVGAEAIAALERVLDAAGYEGVANGEFCVSEEDGRLYLIEVNTRPWGSIWFAERLGQRVADRCVRHALGLPAEAAPLVRAGTRYHNPAGERRWVLLHRRRLRPLLAVARSLRPWDVFEYADASDPRATLRYAYHKLRGDLQAPDE
jgi:predicted ATP-grasp superfamily ATP-dependent carboligase